MTPAGSPWWSWPCSGLIKATINSFRHIENAQHAQLKSKFSHSTRLFCRGVPVRTILLLDLIEFMALDTADASFFRMCPSSQITKSGPGERGGACYSWTTVTLNVLLMYPVENHFIISKYSSKWWLLFLLNCVTIFYTKNNQCDTPFVKQRLCSTKDIQSIQPFRTVDIFTQTFLFCHIRNVILYDINCKKKIFNF